MKIVQKGYLNTFVKPQKDGGWGLCDWIAITAMAENRPYSDEEIYQAIQDSDLDVQIKALSLNDIIAIINYMTGKTFGNKTLANATTATKITYIPEKVEVIDK